MISRPEPVEGTTRDQLPARLRRWVFLSVCALGVSSMVTQLTLMRELLTVFSGNEMVLGIVLGCWLLLTGVGSFLGSTSARLARPLWALVAAQLIVAVVPIAQVFGLRAGLGVVFVRGAMVGVTQTVAVCLLLLLPYCLIAGYVLTLACRLLAGTTGRTSIGQVYFLDVLGDIAGGAAFTFVLVYLLDHFKILYVPAVLNLLLAGVLAFVAGRRALKVVSAAAFAAAAALAVGAATVDLDELSTRLQYAGQRVVYRGWSPYGRLVVTESAGQYNFIENGVPLFSTHDVQQVEETVHYAMAQRPDARNVLLISGGVSGTAREILKYGPQRVDYVELDPLIVEVGRRFLPDALADGRIHVVRADGRLFVKRTARRYDVVIADVPEPSTSQINRFYTLEFFREVRRIVTSGGVLAFSLGRYENYVNPELARLIAVAHRTASAAFRNVLIVPGGRLMMLASDGPLTLDVAARIEKKGIATKLIRRPYLKAMLSPDRLADVQRAVTPDAPLNKDFSPRLYFDQLRLWLSRFDVTFGAMELVLLAALAVYLVRIRATAFAIFTTGFSAAGLEVVLLLAFQIIHGYVYHMLGVIVTAFMAGLAVGSYGINRVLTRRSRANLATLEFLVAGFACALPFVLMGLGALPGGAVWVWVSKAAIPLLAGLLAVLVGMEFPLAAARDFVSPTATASRLYTADFLGACVGAILVAAVLIPMIGVTAVCLLAAGLNVLSGTILRATGRRK